MALHNMEQQIKKAFQSIIDDPTNDSKRSVLADILLDKGHKLGEFISIGMKLKSTKGDERKKLKKAYKDMEAECKDIWVSELDLELPNPKLVTTKHGFLHCVKTELDGFIKLKNELNKMGVQKLKILNVNNDENDSKEKNLDLDTSLPYLDELSLRKFKVEHLSSDRSVLKRLSGLSNLRIRETNILDFDLVSQLPYFDSLNGLDLNGSLYQCNRPKKTYEYLVLPRNLKKLSLEICGFNDGVIQQIESLENLESLRLGWNNLTHNGINRLFSSNLVSNLKTLCLENQDNKDGELYLVQPMLNLKRLSFHKMNLSKEQMVNLLASDKMPSLKHLELTDNSKITSNEIFDVLKNNTNFKKLKTIKFPQHDGYCLDGELVTKLQETGNYPKLKEIEFE